MRIFTRIDRGSMATKSRRRRVGGSRLAVGLLAAAATFGVACYLHLDGRIFFHADAIPLSDLEHPEQELMPRWTSSNPQGTSDDASGPGHRPAHPARSI